MTENGATQTLVHAVRAILRPVVRQLIAHGLTFPAFSRLAKEVYIEVGTHDFALPFKKQTDSRVALVTGITRKEIGQIRRGLGPAQNERDHLDYAIASRVVGRWVAERKYLDEARRPAALDYEAAEEQPSFVGLVAEIGGDIPPRAILDELIRVGAVALSPDGTVHLVEHAYIPARGTEEKLAILGSDASELIRAITHNIEHPDEDPFLQRKVWYDHVGADALPELRARVRDLGTRFVQEANSLLAGYDRDRNPAAPGGGRKRAVVAIYYFDEDYSAHKAEGESAEDLDSPDEAT
ncbi:MAG: DUF6502 family protein [Acidobacteria bacterium]|nr:DUF6502 family protein [Acidobacteriota bacterium]